MLKILLIVLIICTGCTNNELQEIQFSDVELVEEPVEMMEENIYVYVCGAVNMPGVYELREGSRVYEAIEMAGGFLEEAAKEAINQAQVLKDEMKLYIPTMEEISIQENSSSGKVNINTATKEELMTIPGVGTAKADQIISYRNKNGFFEKIEELMSISGIKEGLFEKMKEYITI